MNRRAFVLGSVAMLVITMAVVGLRSFAEAAFIAAHGSAGLPWLFIANALGFAAATLGYAAVARRARTGALDTGLLVALAVAAAAAPSLLAAGLEPVALVVALTAFSQVAALAMWNRVAMSFAGRDARRYSPRAAGAGTLGGAIAGVLAAAIVPRLGADVLPYAGAVATLAVIAIARAQARALATFAPGAPTPGVTREPALSALQLGLLRWLAIVAVLEAAVSTLADLQFAGAIKHRYPDELAVALAIFYGGTNALLFGLQVAAVPRLLLTRSMPVTAAIHPTLAGLGFAAIGLSPAFAAIAATRTADQVAHLATSRAGQELELSALPPIARARWKVLLRGVAWPAGAAATALAMLVAGPAVAAQPAHIAIAAVAIAIGWAIVARAAARGFQAAVAAPLGIRAARDVRSTRAIDRDVVGRWAEAAGGDDSRDRALARAALAHVQVDPTDLADHLSDDSPAVRLAMFDRLARAPEPSLRAELRAAVAIEADDRALAQAIAALAIAGDDAGITRGAERAGLSRDVDRAVAIASAVRAVRDDRLRELAGMLPELVARSPQWATAVVVAHAGGARDDEADALVALAGGADRDAARAALTVIANAAPVRALPALDRALAAGDPDAIAAIGELDAAGARRLAAQVAQLSALARAAIARALAAVTSAGELAGALLDDRDPEVAHAALRGALAYVRGGGAIAALSLARAHESALASLRAHLDARDRASAWTATARGELEVATRRAVARLLWASAAPLAVAGGDPAPLAAAARHLTHSGDAERRRALDVVQELGRVDIVAIIERWLSPPRAQPAGATDTRARAAPSALAAFDPWLARLAAGELAALEPALLALRKTRLFAAIAGPALADLAAHATTRELAPGSELFARGAAGRSLFAIASGEVIAQAAGAADRVLTAGAILGELAVLAQSPRAARAIAGADGAQLYEIDRDAFAAAARRAPELVLGLTTTLASWLAPARADVLP